MTALLVRILSLKVAPEAGNRPEFKQRFKQRFKPNYVRIKKVAPEAGNHPGFKPGNEHSKRKNGSRGREPSGVQARSFNVCDSKVAPEAGLEPATHGLTVRCSTN